MEKNNIIEIEVAYATPITQRILVVKLEEGSTIEQAIVQSGILSLFPEIDLTKQKVGVFSQQKSLNDIVRQGDRVEVYRPLTIDPKEARRKRVKKISPRQS